MAYCHDNSITVHTETSFVTEAIPATSLPGDKACPSIRNSSAPNSINSAPAADREELAAENAFCISKCSNTVSFDGQVSLIGISQELNTW